MHQKRSQIGVSALAQPQMPDFVTCACLSRNQSQPGRELTTKMKVIASPGGVTAAIAVSKPIPGI